MSTPAWAGYAESQGQGEGEGEQEIGMPGQAAFAPPIVRKYPAAPTNSRNTFRSRVFKTSEGHFN